MSQDIVDIRLPLMGEGVTEAVLVKWLKRPGDRIEADEPLVQVSTDKVDTEIPAPAAGVLLATYGNEGDVIAVNSRIAEISTNGKVVPSQASKVSVAAEPAKKANGGAAASPSAKPLANRSVTSDLGRSSPLVRKIARAENLDLRSIPGSGLHGRITKHDILAYMENRKPSAQAIPSGAIPRSPTEGRLKTELVDGRETLEGVTLRREKMSRLRALIAEHMVRSVHVSPHVTTVFEIDLGKIVALKEGYEEQFKAHQGFKLTYTPFFIHAAVQAIKQYPIVNGSVDGDDILYKDDINIGCAVAIDGGLIVPVVKRAGELNFLGIARSLNDLVTRARSKRLNPDDIKGGTFSITNPGSYGSLTSNPIINQPQVAILGIGKITKRPVVIDDMIAVRPVVLISLTFDHRIIDGETGAKFLAALKETLENYQYPIL